MPDSIMSSLLDFTQAVDPVSSQWRIGVTVLVKARILTPPKPDGWFRGMAGEYVHNIHTSAVSAFDLRPFEIGDTVEAEFRSAASVDYRLGTVKGIDGDVLWVLWENGIRKAVSVSQCRLVGVGGKV